MVAHAHEHQIDAFRDGHWWADERTSSYISLIYYIRFGLVKSNGYWGIRIANQLWSIVE